MYSDLVVLYRDAAGDWRWRYIEQGGHLLADSGQGYSRRIDCENGARRVTGVRRRLRRRIRFVTGPGEPS